MNTSKNLALEPILRAHDASFNEQEKTQASSNNRYYRKAEDLWSLCDYVEMYRPILQSIYNEHRPNTPNSNPRGAGRKSYDVCFMFKILMIQDFLDLSDEETVYAITVRTDLHKILGITPQSKIPCPSTIWGYREMFSDSGVFDMFAAMSTTLIGACVYYMEQHGIPTNDVGNIMCVDATYIDVLWRRDSRSLNARIKAGQESAEELYPNPHVRSQKDLDAQFSIKYQEIHFGYKVTILMDAQTKMIVSITVTPANMHDVSSLIPVIESSPITPKHVMGDAGYVGKKQAEELKSKFGVSMHTCKRTTKNSSAEEKQLIKNWNSMVSAIRKNVEHGFANHKNKQRLRTHGLKRAMFKILMYFLRQNFNRALQIFRGKCSLKTANQKLRELLNKRPQLMEDLNFKKLLEASSKIA